MSDRHEARARELYARLLGMGVHRESKIPLIIEAFRAVEAEAPGATEYSLAIKRLEGEIERLNAHVIEWAQQCARGDTPACRPRA